MTATFSANEPATPRLLPPAPEVAVASNLLAGTRALTWMLVPSTSAVPPSVALTLADTTLMATPTPTDVPSPPVLLEPSAVVVTVLLPLAVRSRSPAEAFTEPPVMLASVSPVRTATATAAAKPMSPSPVLALSLLLPSLLGSFSFFSDSLLPPPSLEPPTVALASVVAVRSLVACSAMLPADTVPPVNSTLVSPVSSVNPTVPP